MTRVQKQLSLPAEYWQAIESNIDHKLIRSRGDALLSILDKVYPHLTTAVHTPIQPQPKKPKSPLCKKCKHTEEAHGKEYCYGILNNGGACHCQQFTAEAEQGA
jgi:hypothetical protein